MFTPVILICAAYTFSPGTCTVLHGSKFFETYKECVIDVANTYHRGGFQSEANGAKYNMSDFWCIDWSTKKA